MQAFILITVTLINLALWFVFFIKFRNLFSTEDVVTDTRNQIESLLTDVQHQTSVCINLIDERIKQMKQVTAEADRHIALLKSEIKKTEAASALKETITQTVQTSQKKPKSRAKLVEQKYKKNQMTEVDENSSYAVNDLFSEAEETAENDFTVTSDGSGYGKIPVITPKVIMAENPIVPKKDFQTQVLELYDKGNSIDEIASKLSRSTTEIQLVLDLR